MSMGVKAHQLGSGIDWGEAQTYARAMREGFQLVEQLGDRVTPAPMRALNKMPAKALASILWAMSRTKLVREIGAIGPGEPRALTDEMLSAAAALGLELEVMRSIRP
jgi:2-dehydropantoate 2-reductase